ncbi:hypothetical protein D3C77_580470 [compost metagenome]
MFSLEDIQDAIRQALIDHRQTTLPGQELPFHFYAKAFEDFDSDFVIDTFCLTVLHVHIGCPRFGDDAKLLAMGKRAQASKQQGGHKAGEIGHIWRLRRAHAYG